MRIFFGSHVCHRIAASDLLTPLVIGFWFVGFCRNCNASFLSTNHQRAPMALLSGRNGNNRCLFYASCLSESEEKQ